MCDAREPPRVHTRKPQVTPNAGLDLVGAAIKAHAKDARMTEHDAKRLMQAAGDHHWDTAFQVPLLTFISHVAPTLLHATSAHLNAAVNWGEVRCTCAPGSFAHWVSAQTASTGTATKTAESPRARLSLGMHVHGILLPRHLIILPALLRTSSLLR